MKYIVISFYRTGEVQVKKKNTVSLEKITVNFFTIELVIHMLVV